VVGVLAEELVVDRGVVELEQAEVQTIQVEVAVVAIHHLTMEQAEVAVVGELQEETMLMVLLILVEPAVKLLT
jgi:hypothetical protein